MSLLITVAALVVAIYSASTKDRRLDLLFRIGRLDICVFSLGFVAVIYLQFYEVFKLNGLTVASTARYPRLHGITPNDAMDLVILGILAWFAVHMPLARLTRRKIGQFQRLTNELYWTESYTELLSLMERHQKRFFKIYRSDFLLSSLRRYLVPDPFLGVRIHLTLDANTDLVALKGSLRAELLKLGKSILAGSAKVLPKYEREQIISREIVRTILLSPKTVAAIARTRPYFAINLVQELRADRTRYDFVDLYFTALLRDSSSVLYDELENNQNVGQFRYYLNPSNQLLYFFLSDVQRAHDTYLWKPVGDYSISLLDHLARDPGNDTYSLDMGNFSEVEQWHCPLFASIRFFDIMVREALFQGFSWHMGLIHYIPQIVRRFVRNYRLDDPLIQPESEWPNRYSYLIYRAFDAMSDWLLAIEKVDPAQNNVVLRSVGTYIEPDNIPKSAILAMCESLRTVMESETLPENFKSYVADMVFELYFRLRSSSISSSYSKVLKQALVYGGSYQRTKDAIYRRALATAFWRHRNEYSIKNPSEFVDELAEAMEAD
ncbi:MAG: hypothetical protein Q7S58_16245 [Candidatus Binatus sp.]|uniref:hypothetical protein n=1 Tax=Candidatus Binatus sp. TaxID=2811406 RepID=UPI00271D9C41|nr:hypothetical protein [Candidatus Binatus sp.]MDO8433950.1 hypothetical protein [Candidatus Binatus sp.]